MAGPDHVARPLWVSALLAVLAGALAVLFVASAPAQVAALGIALGSLFALGLGIELWHRHRGVLSTLFTIAGVAGVFGAVIWGALETDSVAHRVEIIPGIIALVVLLAGVTAALRGYERWFVSGGTGLLLLTVFASGLVEDASALAMLAATAATLVAWDVGEQAINMGEQVGRQARTRPVELRHGAGAVIVGGVGVLLALGVGNMGVRGLPLLGLTTLLAAAVVFGAALST